jgi:methyl-accepting chemotaxis protein
MRLDISPDLKRRSEMLNNMRLAMRLGGGFAVVTLLFLVVTVVGVINIAGLNGEVKDMVGDKFPKTVLANDIVDSINLIARAARNALLVEKDEDVKKELARFEEPRRKSRRTSKSWKPPSRASRARKCSRTR